MNFSRFIFVFAVAFLFIFGCTSTTKLTQDQAAQKLKAAGCWYDLSDSAVHINLVGVDWVMSKDYCGGQCKINAETSQVTLDVNPMCTGGSVPQN